MKTNELEEASQAKTLDVSVSMNPENKKEEDYESENKGNKGD